MADKITSIEFSDSLPCDTPARTHRPSGKVWVNSNYIGGNIRKPYWQFILDHEEGHIVLNTSSELEADAYASAKFFNKYALTPFDSVKALTEVLPVNTEEQKLRVELQKQRAAKFDCEHNGKNCEMIQVQKIPKPRIPAIFVPPFQGYVNIFPLQPKPNNNPGNAAKVFEYKKRTINPNHILGGATTTTIIGSDHKTKFNLEFSNFTNCSKYLLDSRRHNCEAENQRERDAQIELAKIASGDKQNVTKAQSDTALQLAQLLASSNVANPVQTTENFNASSGLNKNTIAILVLVSAAIAVAAVLYFMGDKKAA